jgi:hypothetical protein
LQAWFLKQASSRYPGARETAREPPWKEANQFEGNPMQDVLTYTVFMNLSAPTVAHHAAQLYHPRK